MRVTLDWIEVLSLLGAVQGALLAAVLAARRRNRTANRVLAALMLSFTIYLLQDVYYSAGLVREFPHAFGISYPLPWLFGPLVWLYTVTASDRSRRMRPRDWLHFVPVAGVVVVSIPIYSMSAEAKVGLYERLSAGDIPPLLIVLEPLKFVSGFAYSLATVASLRRHQRRIQDSYSNTEPVNLRWLLWFGGGAAVVWVLALLVGTADFLPEFIARYQDGLVALAIAVMVYSVGYAGLRQPEVFRYETAEYPIPAAAVTAPPVPSVESTAAPESAPRYERSGLSGEEAAVLKERLLRTMDAERPWADSELTLADLATAVDTTPHKLSELLNREVGQTFFDFVNGYRVRDVQRRIAVGESRTRKMLALAMDAGFASKSTFNSAFKKITRQTPSQFEAAAR